MTTRENDCDNDDQDDGDDDDGAGVCKTNKREVGGAAERARASKETLGVRERVLLQRNQRIG